MLLEWAVIIDQLLKTQYNDHYNDHDANVTTVFKQLFLFFLC